MQFSCWRYSGRRAGNISLRPLPDACCVQRTGRGQISAVPVSSLPGAFRQCGSDAGPAGRLDGRLERDSLQMLAKSRVAPAKTFIEVLAAPVGYFGSFSMPKGRELTRYCPSPSSHTGVGAKRRHDLGAKLAKDILMG